MPPYWNTSSSKLPANSDEVSPYLEKWLELSPFDARAHVGLLTRLAQRGQFDECEEHLAAAARLFASEDLDFGPVREAWRAIRERAARRDAPGAAGFLRRGASNGNRACRFRRRSIARRLRLP